MSSFKNYYNKQWIQLKQNRIFTAGPKIQKPVNVLAHVYFHQTSSRWTLYLLLTLVVIKIYSLFSRKTLYHIIVEDTGSFV